MAVIRLKRTSVEGKAPQTAELVEGELCINYRDARLFYKNSSGSIADLIKDFLAQNQLTIDCGEAEAPP